MQTLEAHNNRMPMAVLTLITALNIGLIISVFMPHINGLLLSLSSVQIYVLVGLELLAIAGIYLAPRWLHRRGSS